ncbi:polysaccharide biosynthesis tyrosine autokinase [Flexivirga oryzae]|uniref:non-specific protein-tyrosine kinase n=1 Tax=Flexivirga oryzae TaxID=1794944 RepID=A0A839MXL3_9MICO|nr:polysaccharide biosynthesis tyrosine autokinase [Flexivirga oryzae]MBB2890190.1 capsular exopolysaccharide synthesis family protein [Flexivirga oryzae]
MDLRNYLRIFRKRWKTIAITALVVILLTQAYSLATPKKYSSSLQFFVSTSDSTDAAQLAQGSTFSQARVTSYTKLVNAPVVLDPVREKLDILSSTPLASEIVATVPVNTVLIDVTVTDKSPERAQQIAAAVGQQFPKTVQSIERVSDKTPSPVKVTMTKDATINRSPVSPKPTRNLALGLLLGLLLGFGLAILRHTLDSKVRTKDDVEELSDDLTIIGAIPFDGDAPKHPLLVQTDPHSSRAEAFRSLRTNLRFVDAANHPRTIVMTSSLAGEGKTTTTANLALVIADTGASVCLVEGDLRRPRLLEYLGMEGGVGLTDVLIDQADLTDVLQPFGKRKLAILGAGALPPNPSELLQSDAMRSTLEELHERFDYVLIDAPPLLPVTDAAVLSTVADGAVLVVGSGLVTRDQVFTALESLDAVGAKLLGVTLNRVPRSNRVAGYYDYAYGYRTRDDVPRRTGSSTKEATTAKSTDTEADLRERDAVDALGERGRNARLRTR